MDTAHAREPVKLTVGGCGLSLVTSLTGRGGRFGCHSGVIPAVQTYRVWNPPGSRREEEEESGVIVRDLESLPCPLPL